MRTGATTRRALKWRGEGLAGGTLSLRDEPTWNGSLSRTSRSVMMPYSSDPLETISDPDRILTMSMIARKADASGSV
jgi:hypothetical protein